jgi:hypothetical protein
MSRTLIALSAVAAAALIGGIAGRATSANGIDAAKSPVVQQCRDVDAVETVMDHAGYDIAYRDERSNGYDEHWVARSRSLRPRALVVRIDNEQFCGSLPVESH